MDSNEIKALIEAYRVAREGFDAAPDDDCLDWAIDALDHADALIEAYRVALLPK